MNLGITGPCAEKIRRGFTRIELLAVVVIVAISALLTFTGFVATRSGHPRNPTAGTVRSLAQAVQLCRNNCGRWPVPEGTPEGLVDNAHVIAALTSGAETNAFTKEYNPRGRVFIYIDPEYLDPESKEFLDPWGTPYHIIIDLDADQVVTVGDRNIQRTVAVWSSGKNKKNEWGTGDDIASWY